MNANYQPSMQVTVKDWLLEANKQLLDAEVPSSKLDAEIILAHTLRVSRTYLHAHYQDTIEPRLVEIANARLALRTDRVPVAYIIGQKEFYGRKFFVTTATLIPRPESEDIINLLKELLPGSMYNLPSTKLDLIDIGTGSGNLGITAKLEFPKLRVTLSDISKHALRVAGRNAKQLQANVKIIESNLLANYPLRPNIILANLPYVDIDWDRSPETDYEPPIALFAKDDGKAVIEKLLTSAGRVQQSGDLIIIESDPQQHDSLSNLAMSEGYKPIRSVGYVLAFIKL